MPITLLDLPITNREDAVNLLISFCKVAIQRQQASSAEIVKLAQSIGKFSDLLEKRIRSEEEQALYARFQHQHQQESRNTDSLSA